MTLAIIVPYHLGETPVGFACRLAQANGRERVRDFALDVGLDFAGVVAGRLTALDRLADLGGCAAAAIADWAAVVRGNTTFLRGQDVGWRTLRRSHVHACTSCLAEDLADATLEPEVRAWGRAVWQVRPLRTCRVHRQALTEIAHSIDPALLHDFSAIALTRTGNLPALDAASERRSPSALEDHVHGRLAECATGTGFADILPLYAVVRLSETLGAVTEFGPKVRLESLGERELHVAGAVGFDAVAGGEGGLRGALAKLQQIFLEGRGDWGFRGCFGRLYEWLAHECDDPVYDPVRDVVERHVVETMPVGPGESVFGREVTVRRVHSLHSAALEYELHPKRLRKILREDGFIGSADMSRSDERVLFPAEAVAERLGTLAESMSLKRAGEYLGAPRPHERLLFEAGFIVPIVAGGTGVLKDHAFARRDLDLFLERLTSPARSDFHDGFDIPSAAKRANCGAMEIVRLLTDGRLKKVGIDGMAHRYISVLVDIDEVKALVRRDEHGCLSLHEIEKRMRWSTAVVTKLVDGGLLASRIAVNPVNRCPQRVVDGNDLATFDSSYVSLIRLAEERGIHFRRLKALLENANVLPDPAFADIPATFYRRSELDPDP